MNLSHENLVRAAMSVRLDEAQQRRQGHQLARVLRSSRKAEQLAAQARLALARTL
jgi:hypothetical protein